MKNKHLFAICMAFALSIPSTKHANAQGVAFNTTGAAADASAMVDVTSTTSGMLIPRMTNAQMVAIPSPATGLQVYKTDGTPGFYYYNGSSWIFLNPNQTAGMITGTTNYIPIYTSSGTIGNSNIYQNGSRLVVNNGTVTHGLLAIKATTDTIGLYINESAAPTIYGTQRVEYTGSTDANRVGILSTTIRSISDVNGTGIEGAGNAIGVQGLGEGSSAGTEIEGVEGDSYGSGTYSIGIAGFGSNYIGAPTNCYGVYGYASGGSANYAMFSDGNMHVNGTMSASAKSFKIDDPIDPANKYLFHSCIESDEMVNIYSGNVTTDASGDATVSLPAYFNALNKDCRYQLTVIGSFAQAMVAKEVSGNFFVIKTNQPNVKVSWQITGVRNDVWAQAHPMVAEVEKETANKGKYLNAKEYGQSEENRIGGGIKRRSRTNAELSANKGANK